MLFPAALLMSLALVQQTPPQSQAQSPAVTPVVAAETRTEAASAGEAAQGEQAAGTVRVCRTEPVTGSRFGRQVCRNSVETANDRRDSQEMLRRMQGARMPDGN